MLKFSVSIGLTVAAVVGLSFAATASTPGLDALSGVLARGVGAAALVVVPAVAICAGVMIVLRSLRRRGAMSGGEDRSRLNAPYFQPAGYAVMVLGEAPPPPPNLTFIPVAASTYSAGW